MAIGARSQSARTYLEKNLDKFVDCNQDELVKHCMRALRDTLPNEIELTVKVSAIHRSNEHASKTCVSLPRTAPWLWSAKTRHLPSWTMLVSALI